LHLVCIGLGEVPITQNGVKTNFKDAALFANDGVDIILLCRGDTISGKSYYAFVKMKPSRFTAFERIKNTDESFSLQEYGDILKFDYVEIPPEEVINEMRARYGSSL
jgi:hypothetical protein